jgi:hypothetical protein
MNNFVEALAPAVVVHGLGDARLALALARPVTLLSGENAAGYAGCLWWRELLAAAGFTGPSLLDCGAAPGRALEALRMGLPGIILHGRTWPLVAELAAAQHVRLLQARPPALDLAAPGAARHLAAWLGG